MTSPDLPIIDYTSRDYQALRANMITLISTRVPGWTGTDPNDFGVAMVEAYAYGLDGIHYYLDRVMNEAYLSTAMQRESLYSIAEMFHYSPRAAQAASVELVFSNSTEEEVKVPAGTRCQASIAGVEGAEVKTFETVDEIKVPPFDGSNPGEFSVDATEGQTYRDQAIGVSNGYASQRYLLGHTSVLSGTVVIETVLKDLVTTWSEVMDITTALPSDLAFQVTRQTDGSSVVVFGNSLNGMIPELHSTIQATYRVGGGTDGNVPTLSIDTLVEPVIPGISVRNDVAATGGLNVESLESIRVNAAKSFRARDRAVTISDYDALTESMETVSRAKAVGNSGSSVTVFAIPNDDGSGKPPLGDIKKVIKADLLSRSMAGVSVTVLDASWLDIYILMTVYCTSTAYQDEVEKLVRSRLASVYGFYGVDFDGRLAASDIAFLLTNAPGVEYIEVTRLTTTPRDANGNFPPPEGGASPVATIHFTGNIVPFYRDDPKNHPTSHQVITMVGGITSAGT